MAKKFFAAYMDQFSLARCASKMARAPVGAVAVVEVDTVASVIGRSFRSSLLTLIMSVSDGDGSEKSHWALVGVIRATI